MQSIPPSSKRMQRRRNRRLQTVGIIFASYAIDTLLMVALSLCGALGWDVPAVYGAAGAGASAFFYLLQRGSWSERGDDHQLAVARITLDGLINIGCIVWAPQIGFLLLAVTFIVTAITSLRLDLRNVKIAATVIAVLVGAAVAAVAPRLAMPVATWPERAICGVWIVLAIVRVSAVGLFSTQLRAALTQRNAQLAALTSQLAYLAEHDELTGALNRRRVLELLDEQCRLTSRTGRPLAIALVDLDHFKQVNDRFGHLVGDEVLRCFANELRAAIGPNDSLGRYGGEEFLVVLATASGAQAAAAMMDRIRIRIREFDWSSVAKELEVTLSAGLCMCGDRESSKQALHRADAALYAAKSAGRDRVVNASADIGLLPEADPIACRA